MYFHLVYSPECFAVASGRKWTRKRFCQATELMDLIDGEFLGNPTSPPFAFFPCPFHMGILPSFGKAAFRGVLGHTWVQKTQVQIVRKR